MDNETWLHPRFRWTLVSESGKFCRGQNHMRVLKYLIIGRVDITHKEKRRNNTLLSWFQSSQNGVTLTADEKSGLSSCSPMRYWGLACKKRWEERHLRKVIERTTTIFQTVGTLPEKSIGMAVVGDLYILRGMTPVVHMGSTTMLYKANIAVAMMIHHAKVPRDIVIHIVSPLVKKIA